MTKLFIQELAKVWGLKAGEKLFVRQIACNKVECGLCPHKFYAYAASGVGKNRRMRYLGTCGKHAKPRTAYATKKDKPHIKGTKLRS